jgi:hypothetical protein
MGAPYREAVSAGVSRVLAAVNSVQRLIVARPDVVRPDPVDLLRRGPVAGRYQAPRIERLGTLAELTTGGVPGPSDAFGGAGDNGSL